MRIDNYSDINNISKLEAALFYASQGLHVHPLQPNRKEPILDGWQKVASADPEKIREWWKLYPRANVGILCGKVSGLEVYDVDVKNGANGEETFTSLIHQGKVDPHTLQATTPSGGKHYYYRINDERHKIKLDGIDIQAGGSYVVAPPSVVGGKPYSFNMLTGNDIAQAPERSVLPAQPKKLVQPTEGTIPDGNRDIALTSYAGKLRAKGLELGEMLILLREYNKKCDPPKTETDLQRIAKSIARYVPEKQGREIVSVPVLEFLKQEIPPREQILAPWLPTQGLAMVYSPRGVGKTYFSLSMAVAIASGSRFLRWSAPKPRSVLFIDGEMPASDMQERLEEIIAGGGYRLKADFNIITPDLQPNGILNMSSIVDQGCLEPYLTGFEVIILDNISTLCRGGKSENSDENWASMQDWLLQQRAQKRACPFFHHANKLGDQRGHSGKEDPLDTVINLRRPSGYKPDDGAAFEVVFTKNRGFHGDDAKSFEAKLTTDEHGLLGWATTDIEDSNHEKIVKEFLAGNTRQADIAETLNLTQGAVSKHLRKARDLEEIPRDSQWKK